MIKYLLSFLAGAIAGIAVTLGAVHFFKVGVPAPSDIEWLEQPGRCLTQKDVRVLQVLGPDRALVGEEDDNFSDDLIMLLLAGKAAHFYEEQQIKIGEGRCARHVGNYNYTTKDNDFRTVPVVIVESSQGVAK